MDERDLEAIEERLEKAVRQDDQGDAVDPEDVWTFQEHAHDDIRALLDEVRRGKAVEELAWRMRSALEDMEWSGRDDGDCCHSACPSCGAKSLHRGDCELKALLSDAAKLLGEGK